MGDRRDRLVLLGLLVVGVVVSYVTYSRAFYGVDAGLQGRHVLPILSLVPVWAGAVVVRRRPSGLWRAGAAVLAVALPVVVLVGFYLNAQRYAVGLDSGLGGLGDLWFVPQAQWAPPLGWTFWAVEGVAAAVALGATWWRLLGRTPVGSMTTEGG